MEKEDSLGYDPTLAPRHPEFDFERFKEKMGYVDVTITQETLKRSIEELKAADTAFLESLKTALREDGVFAGADLRVPIEALKKETIDIVRVVAKSGESLDWVVKSGFLDRVCNLLITVAMEIPESYGQPVKQEAPPEAEQLSLFEDKPDPEEKPEAPAPADPVQRKISSAIEKGALVSFSNAAFPTVADLLSAFTRESIYRLPDKTDLKEFDSQGRIDPLNFAENEPDMIDEAQTGLFGAMLFAVLATYSQETQENNTVLIYVPKLLEALRIDPRKYSKKRSGDQASMAALRQKKMLELLLPFDRWVGRFSDGSYYRFMTIESYNPEDETMRIISPYLFEIVRRNDKQRYTKLARPEIANERNQAAVEIAMYLLQKLQTRGTTTPDAKTYKSKAKPKKKTVSRTDPDGTKTVVIEEYPEAPQEALAISEDVPAVFTFEKSYQGILRECPQLRHELEKIEQAAAAKKKSPKQAYNAKLKQTFSAAFRILMEKTDAPLYYKNLHFTNVIQNTGEYILPTKTTLSRLYVGLEHNGRNRAYKKG